MRGKDLIIGMSFIDEHYVNEAISTKKATKHTLTRRKIGIMVACLILIIALGGFTYAVIQYWGIGSADNIKFEDLTQPFGTIVSERDISNNVQTPELSKSDLIDDYENIFARYILNWEIDSNVIPSLYFSPTYMIVFTQEEMQGWDLEVGETLTLNFSLSSKQSLGMQIGYVLNGQYHEISSPKGTTFSETITAYERGTYYFCITNQSSSNAVLLEGAIIQGN